MTPSTPTPPTTPTTPTPPIPLIDERPRSLAGAFTDPAPLDGHGVSRLTLTVFEFPLLGGRMAAVHVYGDDEDPMGTYISIADPTGTPTRITLDQELHDVWDRIGMLRLGYLYLPLDPAEAARVRATYAATVALPELRSAHWVYARQIRERLVDGRRYYLIAIQHRDLDDDYELGEISADGTQITPVEISEWSQIRGFETAVEQGEREERERAYEAERAALAAAGGDPTTTEIELPF